MRGIASNSSFEIEAVLVLINGFPELRTNGRSPPRLPSLSLFSGDFGVIPGSATAMDGSENARNN